MGLAHKYSCTFIAVGVFHIIYRHPLRSYTKPLYIYLFIYIDTYDIQNIVLIYNVYGAIYMYRLCRKSCGKILGVSTAASAGHPPRSLYAKPYVKTIYKTLSYYILLDMSRVSTMLLLEAGGPFLKH